MAERPTFLVKQALRHLRVLKVKCWWDGCPGSCDMMCALRVRMEPMQSEWEW